MNGSSASSKGVAQVDETGALNVIDLFSGVGGLSLGAARAGFAVCGAVDFDPKANEAHKINFPKTIHLETDISELTGRSLRHALRLNGNSLAGVIGGPPCQGFSPIGKRNEDDVRNRSFVDFFRIVSEALPKFFLVENVPGILQGKFTSLRDEALSLVDAKYAILDPLPLSAHHFGAATNRKRVFFFGYRSDAVDPLTSDSFAAPSHAEQARVRDALQGLPSKIDPGWQKEEQSWQAVGAYPDGGFGRRLRGHIPPGVGDTVALRRLLHNNEVSGFLGTAHTDEVVRRFAKTKGGSYDPVSRLYRLELNGLCPTLRAGTGSSRGSFQAARPIHPTEDRVITPREAARLQGFPDWFQFSPTKWHSFRQIGNSVSPILAEHIFNVIADSIQAEH